MATRSAMSHATGSLTDASFADGRSLLREPGAVHLDEIPDTESDDAKDRAGDEHERDPVMPDLGGEDRVHDRDRRRLVSTSRIGQSGEPKGGMPDGKHAAM